MSCSKKPTESSAGLRVAVCLGLALLILTAQGTARVTPSKLLVIKRASALLSWPQDSVRLAEPCSLIQSKHPGFDPRLLMAQGRVVLTKTVKSQDGLDSITTFSSIAPDKSVEVFWFSELVGIGKVRLVNNTIRAAENLPFGTLSDSRVTPRSIAVQKEFAESIIDFNIGYGVDTKCIDIQYPDTVNWRLFLKMLNEACKIYRIDSAPSPIK